MAKANPTAVSELLSQRIDAERAKLFDVSGILGMALANVEERPIDWTAIRGAMRLLDQAISALEPDVLALEVSNG